MLTSAGADINRNLLTRLRAEEESAYAEFVARWQPRFERDLRRKGFSPADAGDLSFDCATQALIKLKAYKRDLDGFDGWVLTVGRNHARDWRRKNLRFQALPESGNVPDAHQTPTPAGASDDDVPPSNAVYQARLLAIISSLSAADRQLIEMRYLQGVADFREIAAALNVKTGAARTRHHRIMRRLKDLA